MVGDEQIWQVQDLLDNGRISHDDIAVRVGVPRCAVTEVALGILKARLSTLESELLEEYGGVPPDSAYSQILSLSSVIGRCPECDAKVIMPCRECEVKAMLVRQVVND